MGPRNNQSYVPLGAGMGAVVAVVAVVATVLCIRHVLGFIRFYPCELDVKIPIV